MAPPWHPLRAVGTTRVGREWHHPVGVAGGGGSGGSGGSGGTPRTAVVVVVAVVWCGGVVVWSRVVVVESGEWSEVRLVK